jgi:hypothetical protein
MGLGARGREAVLHEFPARVSSAMIAVGFIFLFVSMQESIKNAFPRIYRWGPPFGGSGAQVFNFAALTKLGPGLNPGKVKN